MIRPAPQLFRRPRYSDRSNAMFINRHLCEGSRFRHFEVLSKVLCTVASPLFLA